jgi:site-specific recombinase XerD
MSTQSPIPLFPTYEELKSFSWDEHLDLKTYFNDLPDWCLVHWEWAKQFLLQIGRNKSNHTYLRFRSEVEKFLLWSFVISAKPVDSFNKKDMLDYSDFFFKPQQSWIGFVNVDKFIRNNGIFLINKHWRPFRYISNTENKDKKKYRPSQQSLQAMFTGVSAFYKYLMDEDLCLGNPAQVAKKDCKHLIKDTQIKESKRLDQDQWDFLLATAIKMADNNPIFERNLFLITAMKSLFLRISELSERDSWIPIMGHFWQDSSKNWWLKVYGKGRKIRDISVPEGFLIYLERYRLHRNLSALPRAHEKEPIVEKLRGVGGMTSRQLARLINEVIEQAYSDMKSIMGMKPAQIFKEISTHWLRHTGASQEIERGRALKDLSEDLGHSSMATTDTVYVQTSAKNRAKSGKNRPV